MSTKTPEIENVNISRLEFDRENPRLVEFGLSKNETEENIVSFLNNVMAVDELIFSIVNSGFFMHEPLIGIPNKKNIVIIEGNRRLAALKVITEYNKYKEFYPKSLPKPSQRLIESLKEIPVYKVTSRKDSWQFIGFKHVNGAAKWGSYAKAQYIAQVHNEFKIPLEQIASQIGDTNKTVQKLYQALMIIEQAEKKKIFNRTDINAPRLYFSHLYTGLQFEGFKSFLNVDDNSADTPEPIRKTKMKELAELLDWIYGSKKKELKPVIQSQNPDLSYLDAVLKNTPAIAALRDTRNLIVAYEISQPDDFKFTQSLNEAKRALYKSLQYTVTGYKGDEDNLRTAGTIVKMSEELYDNMEKKSHEVSKKDKKARLTEK
ncbi:MAG: hypothetical protein J0L56_03150 [Chitinophagales bacterium]|nr:hypothetical protein [Chitinophagales bacterium]